MVFPILHTGRLVLRPIDDTDYPQIYLLRSNETINRYISRAPATNPDQAKEFIKKISDGISETRLFYWAVCLQGSRELSGTIGLYNFSEDKTTAEIGFELMPAQQGKGMMNEALEAVIQFAFTTIGLKCILASVHKDNTPSLRLVEKNNFKKEDDRKDEEDPDNIIYCLLHE